MITRCRVRHVTYALAAVGTGLTLAACGQSDGAGPAASAAQPHAASSGAAAAAAPGYDINRVDNVKGDFPAGFNPEPHPAKTLSQQDIDHSGVAVLTKSSVDPPQCRSLIVPPYAEPTAGTQAAGVKGEGNQGTIDVVALRLTQPVAATAAPAGCDTMSMSGSADTTKTAQRIPAPVIDGVTTTGVELNPADDDDPDYLFTAALGDQTTIVVMGSADDALNPQQMLSDLLVKATAAVRGR